MNVEQQRSSYNGNIILQNSSARPTAEVTGHQPNLGADVDDASVTSAARRLQQLGRTNGDTTASMEVDQSSSAGSSGRSRSSSPRSGEPSEADATESKREVMETESERVFSVYGVVDGACVVCKHDVRQTPTYPWGSMCTICRGCVGHRHCILAALEVCNKLGKTKRTCFLCNGHDSIIGNNRYSALWKVHVAPIFESLERAGNINVNVIDGAEQFCNTTFANLQVSGVRRKSPDEPVHGVKNLPAAQSMIKKTTERIQASFRFLKRAYQTALYFNTPEESRDPLKKKQRFGSTDDD